MYSNDIYTSIIAYFEKHDLKFDLDEKEGVIKAGFSIENKLSSIKLLYVVKEKGFTVYATIPINADKESRNNVAEYITRANYGLIQGNFELDFSDGEIRFKMHFNCGNYIPDDDMIDSSIVVPLAMFKRYGDGLIKVIYGFSIPEKAIDEAENKPTNADNSSQATEP